MGKTSATPMKKHILSLLVAVGLIGNASAQLVAQWKLDGNANDSIGSANGTAPGVTWTDSVINGYHRTVASFDGTGGIIFNSNLASIPLVGPLSISAWVNVSDWSYSGGNNDFVVFSAETDPNSQHRAGVFAGFSQNYSDFSLFSTEDNYQSGSTTSSRASIVNSTAPVTDWSQRTLGISTDQWNLFTWVYDSSNIVSYLNGNVLYKNEGLSSTPNILSGDAVSLASIGQTYFPNIDPNFIGKMSDVRIYNSAMSSSDVSTLYTLQSAPEPSTYALFGIGAIGLLMVMRRKKAV